MRGEFLFSSNFRMSGPSKAETPETSDFVKSSRYLEICSLVIV